MADIVIRGMAMPNERDLWLCISTDGTVYNVKPGIIGTVHEVGTAVPLPEGHGRLIDADALRDDWLHNGANEFVYRDKASMASTALFVVTIIEITTVPASHEFGNFFCMSYNIQTVACGKVNFHNNFHGLQFTHC